MQVITQQHLRESAAARDNLRKALNSGSSGSSSSPIFIGISVTDPDVTSFLEQATAHLPTVLFWDSSGQLGRASRVDGFSPDGASPLARLLAQHVGFSREAKAAQVMETLNTLWGRQTSGERAAAAAEAHGLCTEHCMCMCHMKGLKRWDF